MRHVRSRELSGWTLTSGWSERAAQMHTDAIITSPATITGAVQFDIHSRVRDRNYRIYIYEPTKPCPKRGFPVMYVTDGNAYFGSVAMQADAMDSEVGPVLVVGIGYPISKLGDMNIIRLSDLSFHPPASGEADELSTVLRTGSISYGGADGFYRFLMGELGPLLSARYHIDSGNRTLFGHSMGGLFTLNTLFKHPADFRTFVAASPAIWWNNRSILSEVLGFRGMVESRSVSPRVLITVGSLEQDTGRIQTPEGVTRERFEEWMRRVRMVDNARELAVTLAAIQGGSGYTVEFHALEGETHASGFAANLSRAMRFALMQ